MINNWHKVNLGEAEIAYLDSNPEGGDKTILLLHGFASSASVNWVGTGWVKRLNGVGYRVIAMDNRGHGESTKFYSPAEYGPDIFASDAFALLDHLEIEQCDVMGYSMGARIVCWMCHCKPKRVRKAVFGGMGVHIFGGRGGNEEIAQALEIGDPSSIMNPGAAEFRKFADITRSDRKALVACIRPSKYRITPEIVSAIQTSVLIAVGSNDEIAGSAQALADQMPNAETLVLQGLDHMKSTGSGSYKNGAIEFLRRDEG